MNNPMRMSHGLHLGGGGGAGAGRRSWGGPERAGLDRCLIFDTPEGYAARGANDERSSAWGETPPVARRRNSLIPWVPQIHSLEKDDPRPTHTVLALQNSLIP